MADKYAKYKKLSLQLEKKKAEVKLLSSELDIVKQDIIEEVKNLSKPFKCEYGTFSTYKMKKYTFSPEYQEVEKAFNKIIADNKKDLAERQKADIEAGKAKVEEVICLRYKGGDNNA